MKGFEKIEKMQEKLQDRAGDRAIALIHKELKAIHQLFPGHEFVFWTGAYSPYVKVTPPLHGQTEIREYDIGEAPHLSLSHVANQRKMQRLREHIDRMSKIAVHTEDTYGVNVGRVRLEDIPEKAASQPTETPSLYLAVGTESDPLEIYSGDFFLAIDHGAKGIEIRFCYDGADGPTPAAKWFLDGAAEQLREAASGRHMSDDFLQRRCDLSRSEVRYLSVLNASNGMKM